MSSIVKAKLLTEIKIPTAYVVAATPEIDSAEIEQSNISELNEIKESIIKQAITKAKHIENEAQLRADSLVGSALKSSREIMNNAEKKGYEEGYLRGLVDGASASEMAAKEGLEELRILIEHFRSEQNAALEREEQNLLNIAFELSKKIMRQHVHIEEGAVLKMLEEIVLENEGNMKIYLSEYQKSLDVHIDKAIVKKVKSLSKDAKVVLIKDEDRIMSENEGGIVDMSVPVQLEQLKKAVNHAS